MEREKQREHMGKHLKHLTLPLETPFESFTCTSCYLVLGLEVSLSYSLRKF
jgi:hypothetical protein